MGWALQVRARELLEVGQEVVLVREAESVVQPVVLPEVRREVSPSLRGQEF